MKPDAILRRGGSEQAGFTRTDLVVILGMIVVLALPLVAVTTRDQAMAQQIKCSSNLKQLMVEALLYTADNGKLVSDMAPGSSVTGSGIFLLTQYNPKATNFLMCPAALSRLAANGQGSADQYWTKTGSSALMSGSVGFNGW